MKRFTTATAVLGISVLAFWAIFQVFTASQTQRKNEYAPAKAQSAGNEAKNNVNAGSEHVVPVTGSQDRKIAPVFDGSGAVVSDPSGVLAVPAASSIVNVAPVFDASGAVVSNPSGIRLNTSPSGLVAPVFDANGTVVSDPSGTILNASNP